ncbi:hypothetical protein N7517_010624 [Penicillium concentricum]|uniref:Uncharacterized protein n=1 Tax=Penicillium concentricum TaxID=293559 RepID=A0A9W9R968_9EURO|nr:uncharacterized protein N7517_010624 [Penicillium concentricum]KAJ5356015.1 hypothetical protein N7517_010624 [Penicillium concentricum]
MPGKKESGSTVTPTLQKNTIPSSMNPKSHTFPQSDPKQNPSLTSEKMTSSNYPRSWDLNVIFKLIKYHIDDEYLSLIEYAQTPLEQMIALSVKFKKSRLEDLQPRWERIQKLASKVEVQELFELWNALFTDCDGYLSGNARNQDAFWECVETAGYSSGNCFPLTSQHWIEIPDNVESRNYGDACAQPPSLIKRESIASQHWIQTTDTVNYGNGCARPRSPAKREFIDSPYYVSDCEPTVSIGHASLSPQPGSMADRGDQRGAVSGDDLDKW